MAHITTPRRRIPLITATVVALSGLVLAGCADSAPEASPQASSTHVSGDEFLSAHDLAGLDAAQVIDRLDATPVADRPTDILTSVQPDTLVLTDDRNREARLPMPEDEVYVSVAPYQQQTHECHFHSLTTCLGEMPGEQVHVTITNNATGDTLLDEPRTTYDNGFLGLWLPRDITATITIDHDGKTATSPIATGNQDLTCLTTMQLT